MITLSNGLSFFRAPLALLFLQENPYLRFVAILLAMITDSVDGYLARRNKSTSRFGAILDPSMDKFFVYFALSVLCIESKITYWEIAAMLSRDIFLCIYTLLMLVLKRWDSLFLRGIRWGKVTTALQFLVLMGLTLGTTFSWLIYGAFVAMGWLAFLELFRHTPYTTVKE